MFRSEDEIEARLGLVKQLGMWVLLFVLAALAESFTAEQSAPPVPAARIPIVKKIEPPPIEPSVPIDPGPAEDAPRDGYYAVEGSDEKYTTDYFNSILASESLGHSGVRLWHMHRPDGLLTKKLFAVTALARDLRQHPVNSFLVGIRPFETDNPWLVAQTVAFRMRYSLDKNLFDGGYDEVWQTSRQAYRLLRGDCEDHAIVLSDWLEDLGYEARVVVGSAGGDGHAWVICRKDGRTYLLDATDKSNRRIFPYAEQLSDYHPEWMFDRDRLWSYVGSSTKPAYDDSSWTGAAVFKPNVQANRSPAAL